MSERRLASRGALMNTTPPVTREIEARLTEIEARLKAATPGDWRVIRQGDDKTLTRYNWSIWDEEGNRFILDMERRQQVASREWVRQVDDNFAFLANAKADTAFLIECVRSLDRASGEGVRVCKDGREFVMELATIMGVVDVCGQPGDSIPVSELMPKMLARAKEDRERWHTPCVTDEMVKAALQAFDSGVGDPNDYWKRMRAALSAVSMDVQPWPGMITHVPEPEKPVNLPFERVPTCACDPGHGEIPSKAQRLACQIGGGPCSPNQNNPAADVPKPAVSNPRGKCR